MTAKQKVYPIKVDFHVHITNGENEGTATYSYKDNVKAGEADLDEVVAEVLDSLPEGYRLMTRKEFVMHMLRENGYVGPDMAIPKLPEGQEWHDTTPQESK